MPMYDYKCRSCSQLFEELVFSSSMRDKNITCPYCGTENPERQLSAPAISTGTPSEPACEKPRCSTPAGSGFG